MSCRLVKINKIIWTAVAIEVEANLQEQLSNNLTFRQEQ